MVAGLFAYCASLVLFVIGLGHPARRGPERITPWHRSFGVVLSIAFLHEPLSARLLIAGALMAVSSS
jgi:hypothetical protein